MAKKNKNEAIGFDVQLSKSEAFIEKHLKQILYGLAAVCVVVIAIYVWQGHMESQEQDAANAMAKCQETFAMENYDQALNGDNVTSKGFLNVISEYSGTKSANLAKAYAGLCYYNLGKYDEAEKMLSDYDPQDDAVISPAVVAAIGDCYVEKGDKEKGAEQFVKAAKLADNEAATPVFLLKAGQVYEDLGQADKALELYQEIKAKYYTSAVANDIDKYIERASK